MFSIINYNDTNVLSICSSKQVSIPIRLAVLKLVEHSNNYPKLKGSNLSGAGFCKKAEREQLQLFAKHVSI